MLLVFLLLHGKTKAQEDEKEQKIKRYEWEVMTNPMYVFYPLSNSSIPPPTIMLRKHTEKIKKKALVKSAYRMRISFAAQRFRLDSVNLPNGGSNIKSVLTNDMVNLGLSAGKEWQKQAGKFLLFYGMDIAYLLNYDQIKQVSFSQIGGGTTHNVGLIPFIGVKYFLNSRFALSLESSFNFSYLKYYPNKSLVGVRSHSSYSSNLSPIYNFNFSYYFN